MTTTIAEMVELTRNLLPGDHCPVCDNKSLITCPDHKLIDGWCECCDTGEEQAPKMQCPCEPL